MLQVVSRSNTDEMLAFACIQHMPDAVACLQVASRSNTDVTLALTSM
jgi:hypothetical protein